MKLIHSIIAFILFSTFSIVGHAAPDVASFGVTQGSKDWKQQELEEWLTWRMSKDLAQFVNPELFTVYNEVEFRNVKNSTRQVSNVNLAMFGTVATLIKHDKPKPDQGLFGKVAKLEVTLVVAEHVKESTVEAMLQIVRKRIPMIEQSRVYTTVVRMDPPGIGLVGWIRELKTIIGVMLVLGLLLYGLRIISRQVKFHGVIRLGATPISIGEVKPESRPAVQGENGNAAGLVPMEVISQGFTLVEEAEIETEDDSAVDEEMRKTLLGNTEVSLALRKIRSVLLGMTVEECVNVCQADAHLGSVVTTLLTPEKARKVTSQLKPDERRKIVLETMRWNPESVAKDSKSYIEKIKRHKFEKVDGPVLSDRLSVYLDQVGPEGEEKVFEELLKTGRASDFAGLVRDALPTSLLGKVPDALVQSVLSHMPYKNQVEILAFAPKEISDRVWRLLPKSSLSKKDLIEAEVEKKQKSIQYGDPVSHEALGFLLTVVRQALRTNSEWYEHVKPHVEQYIFQRTKGLQGSSDGRAA